MKKGASWLWEGRASQIKPTDADSSVPSGADDVDDRGDGDDISDTDTPPPRAELRAPRFEGRDGRLYANGRPFDLKGVNWFGMEGILYHAPYGLHVHSASWYMRLLEAHKFNAVRFFISLQGVLQDQIVPASIPWLGETDKHQLEFSP